MTKQQAEEIKKILNKKYQVYFNSKKGELRVCFICWNTGFLGKLDENNVTKSALAILRTLTENGLRPKYRLDKKMYQGFLDCRYLVFE